jgi:hypothetical protein
MASRLVRRDQFNITPQGITHKPTDDVDFHRHGKSATLKFSNSTKVRGSPS